MWHPVKQNTNEPCPCCGKTWMRLRAGKVTGSGISKIMANLGKSFGDPAKKLAVDIAVVELGGSCNENGYTNGYMENGHEQEPIARKLYEDEYFTEVTNGGFYDNGLTGCSPDGIEGNGLIEIKCVINCVQFANIARGSMDPAYRWQCVFNLKESGKDWLRYVSYCSTFPEGKRLFVDTITADQVKSEFELIDARLEEFRRLVESTKNAILGAA